MSIRQFIVVALFVAALSASAQLTGVPESANTAAAEITPEKEVPGKSTQSSHDRKSGEGVSLAFAEAPIERVLAKVSEDTSATVLARGRAIGQKVTLIARKMPLERTLDAIVAQKRNWLVYRPSGKSNTYEIWDQESFRSEVLPTQTRMKVFIPEHITAEEAHKAVQTFLTPNIGSALFDPRTNKVIITDLPYALERVEKLLGEIDYKLRMHVFRMKNADVNAMAEHISNLKSPAAPAPMVDERTRQIIIYDRPDVIRRMQKVVDVFDR